MTIFSSTLKNLRVENGFDSAKQFYEFIQKKGEKSFNYPYYVRMEKGSSQPSSKVLNALLKHFGKKDQETLLNAWCQLHFPEHSYLFSTPPAINSLTSEIPQVTQANELTIEEIAILSENKNNYLIFLLVTLSRYEIKLSELNKFFSQEDIDQAIRRLQTSNLIHYKDGLIAAQVVERVFPEPSSQRIREVYEQFDLWDNEISDLFKFQDLITRKFIRRISFRYITLIEKHLNLVFDLIRTADDVEPKHNDSIVQLQLRFSSGKMPG